MAKPLTRPQFDAVQDLVRARLPLRAVADRAGVSETTVRNIVRGRLKRPAAERPGIRHYKGQRFCEVAEYRCPGCGCRVISKPCLICFCRAEREAAKVRQIANVNRHSHSAT